MNDKLCMGCMREKGNGDICPFCGYSEDSPYFHSYLAPHTVINDRYIVGKVISYNGESVTYLGYDTITGKKVKICEYFPETLSKRESDGLSVRANYESQIHFKAYMSDFIDIAQKLSRMKTLTCITQVLNICHQNNTVYSILEYVDGISLKTYLKKRGSMLEWSETLDLFLPIIKTLSMVHDDGLIHRGLSSDSIILSRSGVAKIDAFCISAVRAARTELVSELFPGFSAPEQYSTVSPHGPWTDVYAICALMYYCLTLKIPTEALLRSPFKPLASPRDRNETIPSYISEVIIKGLSISVSERISNMENLAKALTASLKENVNVGSEAPTVAIPVQKEDTKSDIVAPIEKEKQSASKRMVLLSMVVTLPILLAILIFTFWFLFGNSRNKPEESSDYSESVFGSSYEELSSFESSEESSESVIMLKVKDFVGQDYKITTSNLENLENYIFEEPEYVFDDEKPEGAIVWQSVTEGTEFEERIGISFKVSKGSEGILIPSFDKKTIEEYSRELEESDISYIILYRYDESYPSGYVIGTDHTVGSKYKKSDGVIEVYVNKAPPAVEVE